LVLISESSNSFAPCPDEDHVWTAGEWLFVADMIK